MTPELARSRFTFNKNVASTTNFAKVYTIRHTRCLHGEPTADDDGLPTKHHNTCHISERTRVPDHYGAAENLPAGCQAEAHSLVHSSITNSSMELTTDATISPLMSVIYKAAKCLCNSSTRLLSSIRLLLLQDGDSASCCLANLLTVAALCQMPHPV